MDMAWYGIEVCLELFSHRFAFEYVDTFRDLPDHVHVNLVCHLIYRESTYCNLFNLLYNVMYIYIYTVVDCTE